jgi:hypothetical protein
VRSEYSRSVPYRAGLSRALMRPMPRDGAAAWNSSSLPPMWFITRKAACRAGPMQLSTWLARPKLAGRESSRASTRARLSRRLTSRSSGSGTKGSSTSATTIIWGDDSPAFRL